MPATSGSRYPPVWAPAPGHDVKVIVHLRQPYEIPLLVGVTAVTHGGRLDVVLLIEDKLPAPLLDQHAPLDFAEQPDSRAEEDVPLEPAGDDAAA